MKRKIKQEEGRFYIYTLAYPDGTVFYVGKGQGYRINGHEVNARMGFGGSEIYRIIRDLWSEGKNIIKTNIAFFDNEDDAFTCEVALIAQYGRCNLLNKTDGGKGAKGAVLYDSESSDIEHGMRTSSEVAEILGVDRPTVILWIKRKLMYAEMHGWDYRISRKEIERYQRELNKAM